MRERDETEFLSGNVRLLLKMIEKTEYESKNANSQHGTLR